MKIINFLTISFFQLFFLIVFSSHFCIAEVKNEKSFFEIKKYLQNLVSFEANFLRISNDGSIKEGKIYVKLPGKLRISYEEPDNTLITSNGFWLVVQDRRSKQTTNFPLNQTPLSLFLNKKFNFDDDKVNFKFQKKDGLIILEFLNNEQLNMSSFQLIFSEDPVMLKKWVIIDELENKTSVMLQNLVIGNEYSNRLFTKEDFGEINDN